MRGPDFWIIVTVDEWATIDGRLEPVQITVRSADGDYLTAADIRAARFQMQIQEQRIDHLRRQGVL